MRKTKAIWNRGVSVFISLTMMISLMTFLPIDNSVNAATEAWGWPVPGITYMSRGFTGSSAHSGVDIAHTGTNIEVVATRSGTVVAAAPTVCNHWNTVNCNHTSGTASYGNYIKIKHTDNDGTIWYSLYAHLVYDSLRYKVGDYIPQGAVIAYMGSTGNSSGQHLHFEIRKSPGNLSNCQNPLNYVTPGVVIRPESIKTPTITTDKSSYTVGETVKLSWVASPSNSNLSHYWLTIGCPDGTTLINETMNKNISYSFKVTQSGTYSVTAAATPLGSVNGEGSLYHNVQIPVKPANCTVTLNANGGSVSQTSITVSANGTYSGLPNPLKTGYTFAGWYTALTGGTKKENGSSLASNSNHTLYAHWTANKYKVAFNANGGSGSMGDQTLTYDQAANLTANAFKKTGYSFAGWNTKSDGSGTSYADKVSVKNLATSGTVTLYAQWSAGGYTIVYNANGGSGSMDSKEMKYDQTANLTANAFTAPKGYSFSSWNTKADGSGTSYADKASVKNLAASGTVTLYARWTANKYTVKFDGNGADVLSKTTIEVTYNSVYGEFPEPKREGYNFIGWYTQPEGGTAISPDTKVTITSTQTLYAQWSQVKFLITFNATGGTSESAQKLVTYDKAYGVLPTAERTGYAFKGWYLDEACTKQITSDTIVSLTANQSVYAKWELVKYVITFDATGGSSERDSKQVTYGKAYGVLPSATKDGDEFIGWFTEDGKEITSASIVEIESDTTLYAKWASDDVIGDVNADGVFNVADVVMMQKWLLCAGGLTDWQAGDLCRDERIDVFDLCLMKRMLLEVTG